MFTEYLICLKTFATNQTQVHHTYAPKISQIQVFFHLERPLSLNFGVLSCFS